MKVKEGDECSQKRDKDKAEGDGKKKISTPRCKKHVVV